MFPLFNLLLTNYLLLRPPLFLGYHRKLLIFKGQSSLPK
jgi:hypothetical protein